MNDIRSKTEWIIKYGENLINGEDNLVPKDSITMARYLKIRNVYDFSKSICLSNSSVLSKKDMNMVIHVYHHTEKFIINAGKSNDLLKVDKLDNSTNLSVVERFMDYSSFIKGDPVVNLRKELASIRSKGESTRCKVCDQHVKEYRKSLSSNSARFLFSLVSVSKTKKDGWVHHTDCIYQSRNYPEVAYWGLAYTKKDASKDKKTSGFWRPTQLGVDFIKNKIKIPKYVHVYNAKVVRIDDSEKVSIIDSLGSKFNYSDLMKSF